MVKDVRVWKSTDGTDRRVYVHAADGREGCLYLTGNWKHKRATTDGAITPEEWIEARELALWDGMWHTMHAEGDIFWQRARYRANRPDPPTPDADRLLEGL